MPQVQIFSKFKPLFLVVHFSTVAMMGTISAHAADTVIDIPAGDLVSALNQYAVQVDVNLILDGHALSGLKTQGLKGQYETEAGFNQLLVQTSYQIKKTGNTYTIITKPETPKTRDMGQLNQIDIVAQGKVASRTTNPSNSDAFQLPVITVAAEETNHYAVKNNTSTTKMNLTMRETPQTVTVFTEQLLEDKGLTKVEQVLNHTPGVSMVGDSSEGSQIYVRGFALNNAIQTNGMGNNSVSSSGDMFSQAIDTALAERIEVIKGANGITSGSGEPSATVNMILKRPTAENKSEVAIIAGSWNNFRAEADISGALSNDESLRGRAVVVQQSKDYFVENYHVDKTIVYGVIEKDVFDNGTLSLFADYQRSDTDGINTYDTMPAFYSDGTPLELDRSFSTGQKWASSNIDRYSFMPEFQYTFANDWLIKAQYRYTKAKADRTTFFPGNFIDKSTGQFVSRWSPAPYATLSKRDSDNHTAEIYTSGKFNLFNREHELVFGANYIQDIFASESFRSDNLDPYYLNTGNIAKPQMRATPSSKLNEETMKQSGVFTTLRLNPMDSLKILLGARLSNWEYYSTTKPTPVETKNELIPYFGIVYDINDFASVYTSYTSIFLPQTYYVEGGKIMTPIIGSTIEGGFKLAFYDDKLNVSIATYQTEKDKDIIWDRYDADLSAWIVKAGAPIKTTGYEIEVSGELTPQWNISGGYTNNKVKNNLGEPRMTYVPEDTFKVFTDYQLDGALEGLRVGGGLRWQGDTYYNFDVTLDGNVVHKVKQQQPAYTLIDLFAHYQFNDQYSIAFNVNNLTDEKYNRSMWGYTDFGEPRNYLFTIKAKY